VADIRVTIGGLVHAVNVRQLAAAGMVNSPGLVTVVT
jgi:hypothetical protein